MIITRDLLKNLCLKLQGSDKKIVFTNGCFDIIHAGHCFYLSEAKKLGDVLIIGMNSDYSVKSIKGENRPINNEEDRAIVLDSLKFVDFVTIFNEDTPYELIKEIKPDVLVKGGDYTPETIVGADIVQVNGGKVVVIPYLEGKSTTNIISKMNIK
jgi:rfaE bifunctional protein nucleotidyltransferase chain/domain